MRFNRKDHFEYILKNIETKLIFLTILNRILVLNVKTNKVIKSYINKHVIQEKNMSLLLYYQH